MIAFSVRATKLILATSFRFAWRNPSYIMRGVIWHRLQKDR